MARRRFFVDEIRSGLAALTGDEAAHLTRVLRVVPGQIFEISDNREVWLAEVSEARKSLVAFKTVERLPPAPDPFPIHLFAALFKFDRYEWMIEKTTELGVVRIVPFAAERTEHGLAEAARKRVERWRKIAREAAQQSRRARLPEISDPVPFEQIDPPEGPQFLLDEDEKNKNMHNFAQSCTTASLLLGPEGGWTARERDWARAHDWVSISLNGNVLRAETAAIAAVSILAHNRD